MRKRIINIILKSAEFKGIPAFISFGSVVIYNIKNYFYAGLMKLLYRDNPIRDSVAGTVESIAEITTDTLYDCHKVFYNPSNMALCVAGDVDADKVAKTAEELLPAAYGEKPVKDHGSDEGLSPFEKRSTAKMEVGMPVFLAGARA